jgi:hypothetical protein
VWFFRLRLITSHQSKITADKHASDRHTTADRTLVPASFTMLGNAVLNSDGAMLRPKIHGDGSFSEGVLREGTVSFPFYGDFHITKLPHEAYSRYAMTTRSWGFLSVECTPQADLMHINSDMQILIKSHLRDWYKYAI